MPQRVLVKVRTAPALALAPAQANVRPLFDEPLAQPAAFGVSTAQEWHAVDVAGEQNPWDAAHRQAADALGLKLSDIVYAEPDLLQAPLAGVNPPLAPAALVGEPVPPSPGFAWHLRDDYAQLAAARRNAVKNRTVRIAHIDTGYDPAHPARPAHILTDLERSFVDQDNNPNSAADPNRRHLLDQSGHGTGTIGILAGNRVTGPNFDDLLGGAPDAEVVPVRVCNQVVLFWTSALAAGLRWAIQCNCDVVSISMGGLPSRAWSESVNLAYESGICLVAAAGDCFGGLPTHHVVYPARYRRVIAACGVMSNFQPYYGLPANIVEGNWGPDSSMTAAVAAFTPNIPWPAIKTGSLRTDGAGTSAATPQIAAAAALWLQQHDPQLPEPWMRAEAVRQALFTSSERRDAQHFGRGVLKAADALRQPVSPGLVKTPADNDSFAFFRVITGLGLTDSSAREAMFNVELTQLWQLNTAMQAAIPDPDFGRAITNKQLADFFDAAIADPQASETLKAHLRKRAANLVSGPVAVGTPPPQSDIASGRERMSARLFKRNIGIVKPATRRLRVYALDPSLGLQTKTAAINETRLEVKWEDNLKPGPRGEYLEVIDYDPASNAYYEPANLNDPYVLARDGFDPSEGEPRFHQQMVYAVAMKTISFFERALGRVAFWRPQPNPANEFDDKNFVGRLRIYPHALRQANAYYSPQKVALLFGYFQADSDDPSLQLPNGTVFTCLSHDIIAHETTHALLDGMHRRFNEPSNPDVLAFHEAFADIVALFQHFTIPEVLENQISQTRGDLEVESLLGGLALQFGRATGNRAALRDAIGKLVKVHGKPVWRKKEPTPTDYISTTGTHARGAVLVAAVFEAYTRIYQVRVADLFRIYTNGTGILPPGAIHPDLVRRLASEAGKAARHVLNMCIRALDYIPPVDLTFGEYLRGIITADVDLVREDRYNYRIAFIEAFGRRGIYPRDLHTLSVESLTWQGVAIEQAPKPLIKALALIDQYVNESRNLNRRELFALTRDYRLKLHQRLQSAFQKNPNLADSLGLDPCLVKQGAPEVLNFEVHSLRRAERAGPDGEPMKQVVLVLTQSRPMELAGAPEPFPFRGGSTLILELEKSNRRSPRRVQVRYAITKRLTSQFREQLTRQYLTGTNRPLRETYFGPDNREPFALIHDTAAQEDLP
jgi:hypothetical protein